MGVTITNKCPCAQNNVILNCTGFGSVDSIPSWIVTFSHTDFCLLTPNQPLNKGGVVTFKYVRNSQFSFKLISSQSCC